MKCCARCKEEKSLEQFRPDSSRKDGYYPYCRPCDNARKREWREKNPERSSAYMREYKKKWRADNPERVKAMDRRADLKRKYGITVEEYEALFAAQCGVCAICKQPPGEKNLAVDHNHRTGAIRQLLCDNCNRGLGYLKDDVALLEEAIRYLRRHT